MDESKKIPYAILWSAVIVLIVVIPTGPPVVNIIAGFFPLILTLLAAIGLFRLNKPLPIHTAIGIPIVLSVLLGLLGATGDTTIFGQLSVWYLALANTLGGLGVMAVFTDFFIESPLQTTPSHVHYHVEDVLRYVYAINESIHRVYHAHNGGSAQLRNKILLSTKQAEKLESMFGKHNYEEAHHIVFQLYEELRELFNEESVTLGSPRLRNLERDHHGQSRIIDVLINNDPEPIRSYIENLTLTFQHLNDELLHMKE